MKHVRRERVARRHARVDKIAGRIAHHTEPLHHALRGHIDRGRARDDFAAMQRIEREAQRCRSAFRRIALPQ